MPIHGAGILRNSVGTEATKHVFLHMVRFQDADRAANQMVSSVPYATRPYGVQSWPQSGTVVREEWPPAFDSLDGCVFFKLNCSLEKIRQIAQAAGCVDAQARIMRNKGCECIFSKFFFVSVNKCFLITSSSKKAVKVFQSVRRTIRISGYSDFVYAIMVSSPKVC